MKILHRLTQRSTKNVDISAPNASAQAIVHAVLAIADKPENLDDLLGLTNALHHHALSSDAYHDIGGTLYSLDEYVELLRDKSQGKKVNESYMQDLRTELLSGRL